MHDRTIDVHPAIDLEIAGDGFLRPVGKMIRCELQILPSQEFFRYGDNIASGGNYLSAFFATKVPSVSSLSPARIPNYPFFGKAVSMTGHLYGSYCRY